MRVPVARRNLLAEPGRVLISTVGVAFSVLLVLVVSSLYRGYTAVGSVFEAMPGDFWVAQAGTSEPFRSTSTLPADAAAAVARVPGVALVVPVVARQVVLWRGTRPLDAMALALEAPAGLAAGRFAPAHGTISIDRGLADRAGVGVGGHLELLGRRLLVADTRGPGMGIAHIVFVSGADAGWLATVPGRDSFLLVVAAPGANRARLAAAAARAVPGAETHTPADFNRAFARRVSEGFLPVVRVLVVLGAIIGAGVVALTTYTATVERARDFGVLKALGASAAYLYRIVLVQATIIGVAGAALGLAAAVVAASEIPVLVPEFITDLRAGDAAVVVAAAVTAAALAALLPARRIDHIDPALVFRA
jgi:putative ABC transport system permease protein